MSNTVAFRPNGLRYLVLPDPVDAQDTTIDEFVVSGKRDATQKASEGTVVAAGDGMYFNGHTATGANLLPSQFCKYVVGTKVIYGKYAGYEHVFEGVEYKVLTEAEILGEHLVTPFDSQQK